VLFGQAQSGRKARAFEIVSIVPHKTLERAAASTSNREDVFKGRTATFSR